MDNFEFLDEEKLKKIEEKEKKKVKKKTKKKSTKKKKKKPFKKLKQFVLKNIQKNKELEEIKRAVNGEPQKKEIVQDDEPKNKVSNYGEKKKYFLMPIAILISAIMICFVFIYAVNHGAFKSEFNQNQTFEPNTEVNNDYDIPVNVKNDYEFKPNYTINNYVEVYCNQTS